MNIPKVSVIIRTKNEGDIFKEVLQKLKDQTYQDFEIVQVDDNSFDGTEKLIYEYFSKSRVKLITVPKDKFSHSFSSNLGCKNSSGKYLVFINGHAIPTTDTWLEDGLSNFGQFPKAAGVYGLWKARRSDTFWDRVIISTFSPFLFTRKSQIVLNGFFPGLLQTTNAIILKELWDKKNFNEDRGSGGEDTEWGVYWIAKGYSIILDKRFNVFHSHKLNLIGWIKEVKFWISLGRPQPFNTNTYRYGNRKVLHYK